MSLAGPAPFDLVRMARQLARALAELAPMPPGAHSAPPAIGGPNLGATERGFYFALAANHLNRHTEAGESRCASGAGPCKARGAAYALLEVLHFEVDEHSEEQEPVRALRDTLAELWTALDKATADLQSYLEACDERHADNAIWTRWRSHPHLFTCMRPEMLYEQTVTFQRAVAAAQADCVVSQFHSTTSKARVGENRRQKLRATVETTLREDGWLLREILTATDEVPDDKDEYKACLERLKKRLAGVRRPAPPAGQPANDVPASETANAHTAPAATAVPTPAGSPSDVQLVSDEGASADAPPHGNSEEPPQAPPAA
jgi:hypothetical protein